MLYTVDRELIEYIPHVADYERWRRRLSDLEYEAIFQELNERVNEHMQRNGVVTSSWIPGADWTGTVFQPIYENACNYDADQAALCFGLILWDVMMQREEAWSFGRYEKDGIEIRGLTYFRIEV